MKENKYLLVILVLAICLVSFAFDLIVPASVVHAAGETQPVLSSTDPNGNEAAPASRSLQPVVFIVTGIVCVLSGMVAVSPLLIDDPVRLNQEARRREQ